MVVADVSSAESVSSVESGEKTRPVDVFTRDPDFWHDDGNIIIRIGDSGFKLHETRLRRQSSFFAGLLDGKSSPELDASGKVQGAKTGTIDNCPSWTIQGVSVEDFRSLVAILEDGMSVCLA